MSADDMDRFRNFTGKKTVADDPPLEPTSGPGGFQHAPDEVDPALFEEELPADGKKHVPLPGGEVQILDTAEAVFKILAAHQELFVRGGTIVEVRKKHDGEKILEIVKAAGLRTRAEKHCRFVAWRAGKDGKPRLVQKPMPLDIAEALLQSLEARAFLPHITGLVNCPVVRERNGRLEIVGPGYDRESGLLITSEQLPKEVLWRESVQSLRGLFVDFLFETPSDESRAMAMILTPVLRMGDLLGGHIPIDVAEANESQAGKNYRLKLKAALYNDHLALVSRRQGGVGSMDETFDQHLVNGRNFPVFDNVRGGLDSQHLESFLTADCSFAARVPHRSAIDVEPGRVFVSMTSNGAETTADLANRACIVRIRKQPPGYRYREYPEGDLLTHVRKNQSYYLGCIFTILRAWVGLGKLRLPAADHDFQDWARTLGWIVERMFFMAPLLDGHRAAQSRVAKPALAFLRNVGNALAVHQPARMGASLTARDIAEFCEEEDIQIPGLGPAQETEAASKRIGGLMRQAFGAQGDDRPVVVDRIVVRRSCVDVQRVDGRGMRSQKSYTFNQEAPVQG